jgi:hypothetical protein
MKAPKPFAKETDLCAAFIKAVPKEWTVYAETGGWDILLSRKSDGFQIGIEAKLKFNPLVLQQSLEEYGWNSTAAGPDCRAVLVPDGEGGLGRLAAYIGITVIQMRVRRGWSGPEFLPSLPSEKHTHSNNEWHEWCPTKRHKLPDYVPDVAAGDSAPIKLTEWKIAALRIEATLEIRGYVTRADFAHLRIDHRRWLAREGGWLIRNDDKLVAGPHFPNWKAQHPKVYAEIVADAETWMRKEAGASQ